MKECGRETGNGRKADKRYMCMSGLLLASLGAQFYWGLSERLHGTFLGTVPLRGRKQEVLSIDPQPFLDEDCSQGINSLAFLAHPASG